MKHTKLAIIACAFVLSGCSAMGLPTCESDEAKATLLEAFNQAQFARQLNLSAIEITDTKTATGSNKQMMRCTAIVAMNNLGKVSVNYNLAPRDGGQFMLEFEVAE